VRIKAWRDKVLAASEVLENLKRASDATLLTQRPPSLTCKEPLNIESLELVI